MHAMIVKRLGAVVSAVIVSAGLTACGGGDSVAGPGDDWQPASWEAAVGVTTGQPGSVKIKAHREYPAHDLYPCYNEAELCFNFGEWGELHNATFPGEDARFERLCPSNDIPHSDWIFEYTIYSDEDCHGDVLNTDNDHNNLVCFDAHALTDPDRDLNFTREEIFAGPNENSVLCLSRNADKDWDFTVCEDLTPDPGLMEAFKQSHEPDIALDCGCYPEEDTTVSTTGRGGKKKHPLCYIFPWLHYCHDDGHGGGGHGGGGNGGGGNGGYEPPTEHCVCEFDLDTLPPGCEPRVEADCLITCTYD